MLAALNHPHIGAIYGLEHVDGSPRAGTRARRGRDAGGTDRQRSVASRPRAHDRASDRRCAGSRARARHRPSRPETREHQDHPRRRCQSARLRPRETRCARGRRPGPELPNSPTMIGGTREGVILGSAPYMSPEQARGAAVDKRTDIWAFGCVLYEMLTGDRAFGRDALSDTLAAVLKDEPDLNRVPPPARVLVQRCLEKDPKRRLRDIGDAMPLLETVPHVGVAQRVDRRSIWVAAAVAAICLIGALGIAVVHFGEQPPSFRPVHFQVQTPETGRFGGLFALSPSGRMMAFIAMVADEPHMWVHSFETGQSRPLLNAGSFSNVMFWSPDSRFLAFPIEGKLKKISVVGEQVQTVCDLPPGSTYGGGAWNAENVIVFGGSAGLMQVPAEGGVATPVTVLDCVTRGYGTSRAKVPSRRPAPPALTGTPRRGDPRDLRGLAGCQARRTESRPCRGLYVEADLCRGGCGRRSPVVSTGANPLRAAVRSRGAEADRRGVRRCRAGGPGSTALRWGGSAPRPRARWRIGRAVGMSGAPIWVNRTGREVVTIGAEIREPAEPAPLARRQAAGAGGGGTTCGSTTSRVALL